ncbi:hypothetical protein [Mesorhizobium sp. CAU 1732]|uniref:hypothetical protein n=1 Tax=Mesorhizobium sp. CAU 1732 TaxID=3140358 RepID=UPI0032603BDC
MRNLANLRATRSRASQVVALVISAIVLLFVVMLLPAMAQSPHGVRFDMTVNIAALIAFGGIAAGGIAAWVTVRMRLAATELAVVDLKTKKAALEATIEVYAKRIEEVRAKSAHELSEFKLAVAKEYATNNAIGQIEERLIGAIDRLGDRLDNHFSSRAAPRAGGATRK